MLTGCLLSLKATPRSKPRCGHRCCSNDGRSPHSPG